MQLKAAPRLPASRVGLWGALAALLAAAPARATQDAEARVTLFREPSSQNEGIKVIHPQISAGTTLGPDFRFGVGYEVDIVSGATPAIFGPADCAGRDTGQTLGKTALRKETPSARFAALPIPVSIDPPMSQ